MHRLSCRLQRAALARCSGTLLRHAAPPEFMGCADHLSRSLSVKGQTQQTITGDLFTGDSTGGVQKLPQRKRQAHRSALTSTECRGNSRGDVLKKQFKAVCSACRIYLAKKNCLCMFIPSFIICIVNLVLPFSLYKNSS